MSVVYEVWTVFALTVVLFASAVVCAYVYRPFDRKRTAVVQRALPAAVVLQDCKLAVCNRHADYRIVDNCCDNHRNIPVCDRHVRVVEILMDAHSEHSLTAQHI